MYTHILCIASACLVFVGVVHVKKQISTLSSSKEADKMLPLLKSTRVASLPANSEREKFRLATAVLVIRFDSSTIERLTKRNNAISSFSWSRYVDHLVFHEASKVDSEVLCGTGNLTFTPIDVSKSFEKGHAMSVIGLSGSSLTFKDYPCNATSTPTFSTGYRSMCWFWFSEFLRYTNEYDAIMRIDDDCYLRNAPVWPTSPSPISAVIEYWGNDKAEYINGMFSFFSDLKTKLYREHYTVENDPFPSTWISPYSNVMLYNTSFLRDHVAFAIVADMVQSSRCIWRSRWGDLPLWGATRNTLGYEISHLQYFSYIHGSHGNRLVTAGTEPQRNDVMKHSMRPMYFT